MVSTASQTHTDNVEPITLVDKTVNKATGFSDEQKRYLADTLIKMNIHLAIAGSPQANESDVPETFWGTPVEDLCKEEKRKYEGHVLDIWNDIVKSNDTNQILEGLDQFASRHYGLFNVAPASIGYMVRMRMPACKLRGDQMVTLGDVAEDIAGGYSHITTRGSLQFREIEPNRILELLKIFSDAGLSCKGTGADSARNITCIPTAGFDTEELIDLQPQAVNLSHLILNTRDYQGIPRKFNFSFDNAGTTSCVSDTNDVGFLAVKVLENDQAVEPGIYCRLILGGITGHHDFARDTGFVCQPEDTTEVADAILRVFIHHGNRTNRKKARFKYVLDEHGFDWVCEKIQETLDSYGNGVKLLPLSTKFDAPRPKINRQGHIGVHPQAQQGYKYIGVALRLGKMTPEQMRGVGQIAMKYGKNDIRLTVWQNFIIPHIKDEDVDQVIKELEALGMQTKATSFEAGAVACTGRWACKLGNAFTKEDGNAIIDHLNARFELDKPLNIHLTGCSNSCAQHYIGDIGLVGTAAEDGSEGYNIVIGGGVDDDQNLARDLCGPIASRNICDVSEMIVGNYLKAREGNESFIEFAKRHDDNQIKALLLAQ